MSGPNNAAYFDAAFAGASGALIHTATLSNTSQTALDGVVTAIATAVDAAIPLDGSISVARANLLQGIVAGTMAGRSATSSSSASYAGIAAGIKATFDTLKTALA